MATLPHPTIVIPGITASYLRDEYPLPHETIWSVLAKEYERAALHPDDLRYEAVEPARVTPGQIFEIAYRELVEELRHNLRVREDLPVPVYPFAYDWRQPLEMIERQLANFIDEVIGRTRLLRHYDKAGYGDSPKVNLVGHSMGGLVIAGYLQRAGRDHPIHKIATLATPYQGSYEAVLKITTGTANLGGAPPSSREREAARLTPGLYHLLPSFANAATPEPASDGRKISLFDPDIWQPSIIETLKEYIRLHALERTDRDQRARDLFASLLQNAKEHRSRIDSLDLAEIGLTAKNWLCIVGVGAETRVRLTVDMSGRAPDFVFRTNDRQDFWEKGANVDQHRLTGDGTVPFEGALPKFLPYETLVCVSPDDFGYWEIQDRALTAAAGFHGILPNMDMLHRLIVRHFADRPDRHGNTWGRPPPGITQGNWAPPIAKLTPK